MSFDFPVQLPGLDAGSALLKRLSHSGVYSAPLSTGVLVLLVCVGSIVLSRKDRDGFPFLPGFPIIGSWKFFTKRHHFTHGGLSKLGEVFSFNILQVWFLAIALLP